MEAVLRMFPPRHTDLAFRPSPYPVGSAKKTTSSSASLIGRQERSSFSALKARALRCFFASR